jgi:hypothetical protein
MRTAQHAIPSAAAGARKLARGQAGLTLIETTIALGILMFGIIALLGPMYYATSSMANSKRLALATEIAASRMEEVKSAPILFFARAGANRPAAPFCDDDPDTPCVPWTDTSLNLDFGEIPDRPEFACWVILESNLTNNTAIIRIPVVWIKPGGRFSTTTGEAFNPLSPDAPSATVELISTVQYR